MAARAICIVGLPGSGKTTLAKKMVAEDSSLLLFDDLTFMTYPSVIAAIEEGKSCIIVDVNFCNEEDRREAEHTLQNKGAQVKWIFFENAPDKCLSNVRGRQVAGDVREVGGSIDRFKGIYVVPKGVRALEVTTKS